MMPDRITLLRANIHRSREQCKCGSILTVHSATDRRLHVLWMLRDGPGIQAVRLALPRREQYMWTRSGQIYGGRQAKYSTKRIQNKIPYFVADFLFLQNAMTKPFPYHGEKRFLIFRVCVGIGIRADIVPGEDAPPGC